MPDIGEIVRILKENGKEYGFSTPVLFETDGFDCRECEIRYIDGRLIINIFDRRDFTDCEVD